MPYPLFEMSTDGAAADGRFILRKGLLNLLYYCVAILDSGESIAAKQPRGYLTMKIHLPLPAVLLIHLQPCQLLDKAGAEPQRIGGLTFS
jgi:hypothetical protein